MSTPPPAEPPTFPFIVVDGPDGVGKTTLVRKLTERYIEHGVPCIPARNPAGTRLGAKIREATIDVTEEEEPDRYAQLLCQVGATTQLLKEKLYPNRRKAIVIFDRYLLSTIVYQGHIAEGSLLRFVPLFNQLTAPLPTPEMTIVLQADPQVLMARRDARNEAKKPKKPSGRRGAAKKKNALTKAVAEEKDVMESDHRISLQAHGFSMPRKWLPDGANLIGVNTSEKSEDEVFEFVWGELCKVWKMSKPEKQEPSLEESQAALAAFQG